MREFLVLVLVLGTASLANAGLVLTVNGVDGGTNPEMIHLESPSDTVLLGLELPAGSSMMGYQISYLLNGPTELIYDDIIFPADTQLDGKVNDGDADWVEITAGNMFGDFVGPAVLMEGLLVAGFGGGDAVIEVVVSGSTIVDDTVIPIGTVLQTICIDGWIPEPMTFALLGLGGLFLRRRR